MSLIKFLCKAFTCKSSCQINANEENLKKELKNLKFEDIEYLMNLHKLKENSIKESNEVLKRRLTEQIERGLEII